MTLAQKNVYTIPAGVPFAKALAAELLKRTKGEPETLSCIRIFLPTRRACAILKDAFLQLSDAPLLLPRMQPLGDIDEEELSVSVADKDLILDIPPAISPLRRQVLLARAIEKIDDFTRGFDQALLLADALGRLMDQIHTEGLELENLDKIVPAEFAAHWQITVDFMKILSETWPKILKDNGVIDMADRRNRLIRGLSVLWAKHPPAFPVIAAGSTGSIPATAELLNTIAAMKQGSVILPGLDSGMDEADWNALAETHPQFMLRHLLQYIKVERGAVKLWPCEDSPISAARRALAAELMRPAETTLRWAELVTNSAAQKTFSAALAGLQIAVCGHEREEASTIALLMRETLETPGRTAALITPDRNLARRVAASCRRWGINIDDSAGQALNQTPHGLYIRLCLQAVINDFSPVSLLSLLKHEFTACGMEKAAFAHNIGVLEKAVLRGPRPAPGIQGILDRLGHQNPEAAAFLKAIEPRLNRFSPGSPAEKPLPFRDLIKSHLQMAEAIADTNTLRSGEAGEAAANLFAELLEQGAIIPPLGLRSYAALLDIMMKAVTVRPAWGTHPRLKILGTLEARLNDADLIILGGLNEASWPPDPGHDPWMSRPMRGAFGLPPAERHTGLAAHDFVQGFCAQHVVLTRSNRKAGAPAVPSRWLQRLETVLGAAKLAQPAPVPAWAAAVDAPDSVKAFVRPGPRPPVAKRPRRMAVTGIEKWMRDPYSVYARHILKLRKLDPLEKPPDAAEQGKLLHNILQQFVAECPQEIPANVEEVLHNIAARELAKLHDDPAAWSFWQPRFARLAAWLGDHEKQWRKTAMPVLTELKGEMSLRTPSAPFTLEARPDRIDRDSGNQAAVIDYKSGGQFSMKKIKSGDLPQLSLEALILQSGGFKSVPAMAVASLSYWVLTGGSDPGEIIEVTDDLPAIIANAKQGLVRLVEAFDKPETPYYSLPFPLRAPPYNDYEHLARVQEWAVLGDAGQEAA